MKSLIARLVLLVVLLFPSFLEACSVCGGRLTPDKQSAYVNTTLLLASLPLVLCGSIFFAVYKKYKQN